MYPREEGEGEVILLWKMVVKSRCHQDHHLWHDRSKMLATEPRYGALYL